jgi:hypothetical protein
MRVYPSSRGGSAAAPNPSIERLMSNVRQVPAESMDQHDRSAELRAAFLHETPSVLPGTIWRDTDGGASLEYPQASRSLGL